MELLQKLSSWDHRRDGIIDEVMSEVWREENLVLLSQKNFCVSDATADCAPSTNMMSFPNVQKFY